MKKDSALRQQGGGLLVKLPPTAALEQSEKAIQSTTYIPILEVYGCILHPYKQVGGN